MNANSTDWGRLRLLATQRLRARFPHAASGTLDDLSLEVLVTLFRMGRHEPLANPQVLTETLVQRVAEDHIRRMRGPAGRLDPVSEVDTAFDPAGDMAAGPTDMLELFRFLVLQHFHEMNAPCETLASRFFAKQSWSAVGEELELRPQTAIKRWSVCMAQVRKRLQTARGPVWVWARSAGPR